MILLNSKKARIERVRTTIAPIQIAEGKSVIIEELPRLDDPLNYAALCLCIDFDD